MNKKKKTSINPIVQNSEVEIAGTAMLPNSDPNLPTNPNVQTFFADIVQVLSRNDGLSIIRWLSRTPGVNLELSRIVTTHAVLKSLTDILCRQLDHYPTKESLK